MIIITLNKTARAQSSAFHPTISPKIIKKQHMCSPKILTETHNRCVRMDSTCLLLRNFQTRNIRIVILHILDRTDCQKHRLKNQFKGIFPKIPKIFSVYFLYKSLTPIVGRRWLRNILSLINISEHTRRYAI